MLSNLGDVRHRLIRELKQTTTAVPTRTSPKQKIKFLAVQVLSILDNVNYGGNFSYFVLELNAVIRYLA